MYSHIDYGTIYHCPKCHWEGRWGSMYGMRCHRCPATLSENDIVTEVNVTSKVIDVLKGVTLSDIS